MYTSLSKRYYTIGETSEILGLPASTLRYWESVFKVLRPQRSSNGIETLRMIRYMLHDKGMHIDAAREQLKKNRDNISRHAEAVERLKKVRAELAAVLDALHSLR